MTKPAETPVLSLLALFVRMSRIRGMKSVSHIFGGEGKVKIMRLFIFNPRQNFDTLSIATRVKENPRTVRRELKVLIKAGLIRKRPRGYILDEGYPYLKALQNFMIDAAPLANKDLVRRLSKAGIIKLVLISGVFIHDPESRVDLLVVGDNLKKNTLISAIASIEAELGKELRYAAFETVDFKYRIGVYDKLVRDILEYPHEKILNKLGL